MRIDIITVLPEMFESPLGCSILQRAQKKGLVEFHVHNLRDYTTNKHRKVDDYPFGGEAGMVMQVEPIDRCISALKSERDYDEVIFTSPDGERFDQPMANRMSMLDNIIILCGHYKGVDYRVREHLITKEISIGDYVLTGGELAAMVQAVRNVETAMGNGEKVPSQTEVQNITAARKSIVAKRNIRQGEIFTTENITTKRPGNGITPMLWNQVLGTPAVRDFEEDELIEL